ncbi:MAG: cation transporter, partial [Burkholderiales bacterium]|nr:cation transporter [Burkholderiales bacterium]
MCSTHGPGLSELKTNNRLKYATALNCIFVVLEFAAGVLSGSLALVTDSVHNAVDSLTLALAFLASWVSQKPADKLRTYGYHRAKVLMALMNAIILVFVLIGIGYFAFQRFANPMPVDGAIVAITGAIG